MCYLSLSPPWYTTAQVYLGGSVLADIMKDKDTYWMSRAEYEEKGIEKLLMEKCAM